MEKSIQIPQEIEHDWTDEVVCPWCGYEHTDSWERHMDNGGEEDEICSGCGKNFTIECDISVTYSTSQKTMD